MKDLEWLKKEVKNYIEPYDEEDWLSYKAGTTDVAELILGYIDQVEQPELPVIPQFVAEWIECLKSKKINLLENIYDFTHDEDINNYIREQGNALMRAWLDGYTVEEEQKYYVEDGKHTLLCKWESSDGWKVISTIESTEDDLPIGVLDFELTEQEIKDYDERYWPFAKEVTE